MHAHKLLMLLHAQHALAQSQQLVMLFQEVHVIHVLLQEQLVQSYGTELPDAQLAQLLKPPLPPVQYQPMDSSHAQLVLVVIILLQDKQLQLIQVLKFQLVLQLVPLLILKLQLTAQQHHLFKQVQLFQQDALVELGLQQQPML
jgi:hypothetical protein